MKVIDYKCPSCGTVHKIEPYRLGALAVWEDISPRKRKARTANAAKARRISTVALAK